MSTTTSSTARHDLDSTRISDIDPQRFARYRAVARDGTQRPFDPERIARALAKSMLAAEGGDYLSAQMRDLASLLSRQVCEQLAARRPEGGSFLVEEIQDQAELVLMRAGQHDAARRYVLYREERRQARATLGEPAESAFNCPAINVTHPDGTSHPIDSARLERVVKEACGGLDGVDAEKILKDTVASLFDGVPLKEVGEALLLAARMRIEEEPNYTYVAARLLLDQLREEACGEQLTQEELKSHWVSYFSNYIKQGVEAELLSKELLNFDLERLANACSLDRDYYFQFLGLQTLRDRYFQHIDGRRIELPQAFWMRVAMGLSISEVDREAVAISFYEQLSSLRFVSSTPTLFNSGCISPQLSSCFLTTVQDDLGDIYKGIRDNALLSKFSGGLGNDWTPVRGLGSHIKGTNGKSQGVIPFLKVANDTAVAVNQGGRRKGAVCAYLETWHVDFEEFLDLRKNTGDDRRRTHDMNTAAWVPDLFMERVENDEDWALFSPDEATDLHDLYGDKFREAFERYEALGEAGQLRVFKRVKAADLWRKLLSMLFETGHPWITFKDACNIRSPQQHCGVIHSSNLCTEITLNTSSEETAVCNLGSVNLAAHTSPDGIDQEKIEETIAIAMRMLDNVIDINLYTVPEARRSNLRHRPVGLGIMGFQDALAIQHIPYSSEAAITFADQSMEIVSYYAILGSSRLARERGAYQSYPGSLWSKGILPVDSIKLLRKQRSSKLMQDDSASMDWEPVRKHIAEHGMRNSNCLAIAPTATISNIAGVGQSIEPIYQNLYVKANMSGDFTVINMHLVTELKKLGLWDRQMAEDLKYYDGSLQKIPRIPDELKKLFECAFEVHPKYLLASASARQKWLDQSQSLNIYVSEPNGRKIEQIYMNAWKSGLKTTYYLRSMGATHVEKSTGKAGKLNAVPSADQAAAPKVCSILDPDCEACQ